MSSDDGLYRGDPPSSPPPGSAAPTGSFPAPGYAAPPGYGPPPGYGMPPGYGRPPGYGLPPGYRRPTNTLAVLALVMAFVFAPAGLALGVVARRQIRETGEEGDGLALAGITVGAIVCALAVLGFVLFLVALASLSSVSFAP